MISASHSIISGPGPQGASRENRRAGSPPQGTGTVSGIQPAVFVENRVGIVIKTHDNFMPVYMGKNEMSSAPANNSRRNPIPPAAPK